MKNQSRFRDYNPDQLMLFPADLKQWLPEDDLVYFLIDIVAEMDLQPIYREYEYRKGGQPAYHPKMMVSLLLYAYCVGMPSSRKIEQANLEKNFQMKMPGVCSLNLFYGSTVAAAHTTIICNHTIYWPKCPKRDLRMQPVQTTICDYNQNANA